MIAFTLRKGRAKTADYTLKLNQPDRSGARFTNRGASGSVTFTLPTPALAIEGTWYEFQVIADQSLIVSSAGKIVAPGNAAADNVGFQTASQKIGGRILVICDGTSWLATGERAGGGFAVNGTKVTGDSVTAGTVAASSLVVVDANKAVDTLRATTDRTLGGTGVAGGANVQQEFTKEVAAIADATATVVLTVTVPNSVQAAQLEIGVIGRLGAGGAIGADEAVATSKYQASIVRTAGVASVCTLSSQLGSVAVAVAGAATVTATLTSVANAEGVGVTNTHTIKVTITKSGGSSANHKCDLYVRLHNANASGVTVA